MQIRAWLAARNMPFSVPPLCLWPLRLRGKSWNRIAMDELACQPSVHAIETLVQVQAGNSATLSCQVHANPEASLTWFFADRLIANLSLGNTEEASAAAASATPSSNSVAGGDKPQPAQHQVYYLRESGTMDKTSHLMLGAAREQDSGTYVCWATNKADRVAANITLLVRGGTTDSGHGLFSGRGLTAGLILAVFTILITFILICIFCSMKRARMHASMHNRRNSVAPPLSATQYDKSDMLDPFIRRQNEESNGFKPQQQSASTSIQMGSDPTMKRVRHPQVEYLDADQVDPAARLPQPDKQWLVSKSASEQQQPGSTHQRSNRSSMSAKEVCRIR